MAIIKFTFTESDVPANAVKLREVPAEKWGHKMWIWETHVGLCIKDREMNGYNDSDWYMTVWNFEKNQPEEICFASTRGWAYPAYGSYADATPEVKALYNAWVAAKQEESRLYNIEVEKKTIRKYKEVKVVCGRKVPIGTVGRVFWIGQTQFGQKVGIETASGQRHFTSINNVEVIQND
jgi:hypothetical protein